MEALKRMWLYTGLVAPSGAAFARPVGASERAPTLRVLLAGGDDAVALAPTFQQLAADDHLDITFSVRPGTTAADWAERGWAQAATELHRPTAVLLALTPGSEELSGQLEAAAGAGQLLWLPAAGASSERVLPRTAIPGWRDGSAKSYAAWAASAWRVVR